MTNDENRMADSDARDSSTLSSFRDRLRQAVSEHARATRQRAGNEARTSSAHREVIDAENIDTGNDDTRLVLEKLLGGTWHATDLGPAFIRDELYPVDHVHGRLALRSLLDASETALGAVFRREEVPPVRKFGFLDLETTGLSGGTGTYFFLAGLGSFTDAGFRIRQYFLADLRHEPAMLSLLTRDLKQLDVIVTYNGRRFDLPCVGTRMLLAREPSPFGESIDFDLLYAVRRLYRHRLPSCRLGDAEARLLGVERPDDLPGWMAPTIYFDYLRAGRIAPLRGVIRHNVDDILSMAGLLAHIALLFDERDPNPRDAASLARWWEYANEMDRARTLYAAVLPALEGEDDWRWAAQRHALLCKRAGARPEAARLWERLWAQGDRRSGLELAMHFEHHTRDLASAEKITRHLRVEAGEDEREALEHRLRRLARKQARLKTRRASETEKTAPTADLRPSETG